MEIECINVFRPNRPAPLKVTLSSRNDVIALLKAKKSLRNTHERISFGIDQSNIQREYYKKNRHQLIARKEDGEQDIFIKYKNGISEIAKSKNSRLGLVL